MDGWIGQVSSGERNAQMNGWIDRRDGEKVNEKVHCTETNKSQCR